MKRKTLSYATKALLATAMFSSGSLFAIQEAQACAVPVAAAITAGIDSSYYMKSDGTVYSWGANAYGQLGNTTFTESSAPVGPVLTDVMAFDSGGVNVSAVRHDGTAWFWGIEPATNAKVNVPKQLSIENVKDLTIHSSAGALLKQDGTVWTFGMNSFGQLGVSGAPNTTTPIQVTSLTDVKGIEAGDGHIVALKNDGTVWSWGKNDLGQLGIGGRINQKVPVQVPSLSGVVQVSAIEFFSMALKSDGTVWAWGENSYGQLGDETQVTKDVPTQVKNLTNVKMIAAGRYNGMALKEDGTVWAWGYNGFGQLGIGTTGGWKLAPIQVQGLTDVIAIEAGYHHNLAIKKDGTVWAWGYNNHGQVGQDPVNTRYALPTQVIIP
ncbi:RCC1 domain-containing protein [Brevibacillus dissolubilis]|uniref:RCC1 domain-containing protein n=1 Tax=Brevibacillus dissolubilis TaxID=1844116 RepID=UPI001115B949|nr:RCC1 repeat- and reductase domain-containing protein [Brevibacillus dissolubilis]